jgi:hypothetical protein
MVHPIEPVPVPGAVPRRAAVLLLPPPGRGTGGEPRAATRRDRRRRPRPRHEPARGRLVDVIA